LFKKTTKNLRKTEAYPAKSSNIRGFGLRGRLVFFVVLLLTVFGAAAGLLYSWSRTPLSLQHSPLEFSVPAGTGLRAAVTNLNSVGVSVPHLPMLVLARYRGSDAKIKAGTYEIQTGVTPWRLLEKLERGEVVQVEVVIPEGWSFRQLRIRLDAQPHLRHDTTGLSDDEVLKRIGASELHPEGLFFPDKYRVEKGGSDLKVLAQAYKAMQAQLAQSWSSRDSDLPFDRPYQALIMASIIEKETGIDNDRPLISAVFVNRLRKGMPLQTDPTVIYGVGPGFDGNLRRRDLLADTPYNTYRRGGLPPTPIAMPGRASLEAALHPAKSDAVFFVARGDGSSEFSSTLAAHNRAVDRFQRGR
jgi:UPF0755 protein